MPSNLKMSVKTGALYNVVMGGMHPMTDMILKVLRLERARVPRLRDAWLENDGQHFVVLTRTGGGNRDAFEEQNRALEQAPGFVDTRDDPDDGTFALWRYRVPDEMREHARRAAALLTELGMGAEQFGVAASLRRIRGQARQTPQKTEKETTQLVTELTSVLQTMEHLSSRRSGGG